MQLLLLSITNGITKLKYIFGLFRNYLKPVMLRPRGQTGFEAKISASASISWRRPRALGLSLASVLLTWPQKICYPIQDISCIHVVFVPLQHLLETRGQAL